MYHNPHLWEISEACCEDCSFTLHGLLRGTVNHTARITINVPRFMRFLRTNNLYLKCHKVVQHHHLRALFQCAISKTAETALIVLNRAKSQQNAFFQTAETDSRCLSWDTNRCLTSNACALLFFWQGCISHVSIIFSLPSPS